MRSLEVQEIFRDGRGILTASSQILPNAQWALTLRFLVSGLFHRNEDEIIRIETEYVIHANPANIPADLRDIYLPHLSAEEVEAFAIASIRDRWHLARNLEIKKLKTIKPSNIADAAYHPRLGIILYWVAMEDHEVTIENHPFESQVYAKEYLAGWFSAKSTMTANDYDGYLIPVEQN